MVDLQDGVRFGPMRSTADTAITRTSQHDGPASDADDGPCRGPKAKLAGDLLREERTTDDRDEREDQPDGRSDRQADPDPIPGHRRTCLIDIVGSVHGLDDGHGAARGGPQCQEGSERHQARLLLPDDPLELGLDASGQLGGQVVPERADDLLSWVLDAHPRGDERAEGRQEQPEREHGEQPSVGQLCAHAGGIVFLELLHELLAEAHDVISSHPPSQAPSRIRSRHAAYGGRSDALHLSRLGAVRPCGTAHARDRLSSQRLWESRCDGPISPTPCGSSPGRGCGCPGWTPARPRLGQGRAEPELERQLARLADLQERLWAEASARSWSSSRASMPPARTARSTRSWRRSTRRAAR